MTELIATDLPFLEQYMGPLRVLLSPGPGLADPDQAAGSWRWRSVVEHCLIVATAADALARLLDLGESERERVVRFLLIHDVLKRIESPEEISWASGRSVERAALERALAELDPSGQLMRATSSEYITEGVFRTASLLERITHYVDNLCAGGVLTIPDVRLNEVASRQRHLPSDYWREELRVTRTDAELFAAEFEGSGFHVPAARLPELLVRRIMNPASHVGLDPVPGVVTHLRSGVALSNRYFAEWMTATPRAAESDNEDRLFIAPFESGLRIGVVDGATGITRNWPLKESPGRAAAIRSLESFSWSREPVGARALLDGANRAVARLAEEMRSKGYFADGGFSTSLFACEIFWETVSEADSVVVDYAALGDCDFAIRRKDGALTWPAADTKGERFEREEIAVAAAEATARGGAPADVLRSLGHHPKSRACLLKHRDLENSPDGFGYGSLKGDVPDRFELYIRSGRLVIEAREFEEVVFVTDGCLAPVSIERQEREQGFATSLDRAGVLGILADRFEAGNRNPRCDAPPCLKPTDDCAIIRVRARR